MNDKELAHNFWLKWGSVLPTKEKAELERKQALEIILRDRLMAGQGTLTPSI